jgi:hypothetical protein
MYAALMLRKFADPETEEAVLAAFTAARRSGLPPVECYRAGVEAWRARHPDQAADYAAKHAVAVVLAAEKENLLRVE